jgi:regulatory protein
MVITRIERQKKNPRRYSIYVDDEFVIGVDRNVIIDKGLRKGDSFDNRLLLTLRTADELIRGHQIALRFLSYRPRSEAEIRTRLDRETFQPETIEQIITQLYTEGQLDDKRFAEMYAQSKMLKKPIGAARLRRELRLKDISDTIIRHVEQSFCDYDTELNNARHLAKKKLASERTDDPVKRKRRLADYLGRRGFGWDVVSVVVEEFLDK